jgi:hypothetical protein
MLDFCGDLQMLTTAILREQSFKFRVFFLQNSVGLLRGNQLHLTWHAYCVQFCARIRLLASFQILVLLDHKCFHLHDLWCIACELHPVVTFECL